jgi:hypothetical protein
MERVEASLDGPQPFLSYVFVNAGHFPYERNAERRPDQVEVSPEDPVVEAYVNAAHYNAVAVEGYVSKLLLRDPAALVVVLGDHQPLLGPDFGGHRLGGRLPSEDDVPPLHRASMYETPLLVLDGGTPVPVGRLPAYLLPEVVLDILSAGTHCRTDACQSDAGWRLRPFRDHAIEVEARGPGERMCALPRDEADPHCAGMAARALSWQLALFRLAGLP